MSKIWMLKQNLTHKVKFYKEQIKMIYFASKHPDTPVIAKLLVITIVGLTFSPIDLIPDFIPILGIIDDLLIIPFGIFFAIKLIPNEILRETKETLSEENIDVSPWWQFLIILIWIIAIVYVLNFLYFAF